MTSTCIYLKTKKLHQLFFMLYNIKLHVKKIKPLTTEQALNPKPSNSTSSDRK